MYTVLKRDGKIVEFDISKISGAIALAFEAQERNYTPNIIDFLALKVTADFEPKIKDGHVSVEDIQDSVESVLIQAGYDDVAKAYILYRRQHARLREMRSTVLDYKTTVDNYVSVSIVCRNNTMVTSESTTVDSHLSTIH
jgi:ribonucleoside-triphosphate reductase